MSTNDELAIAIDNMQEALRKLKERCYKMERALQLVTSTYYYGLGSKDHDKDMDKAIKQAKEALE